MAPKPPAKTTVRGGSGLTRKLGPLPLWAWGAIGVAGIVAGLYLKNRLASSTQQSTSNAATPDTSTAGTTYPDLGGATSGGGAGSIPGNNFPDLGTLLSALQPQTGPPAQQQPINITEPSITLPAPLVTYVGLGTSSGAKTQTSAKTAATTPAAAKSALTISPGIVATNYGSNFLPIPVTGPPTVYQSPTGATLATVYNTPHVVVAGPSGGSVSAKTVAAARPGGVSANKQQGVYSIH